MSTSVPDYYRQFADKPKPPAAPAQARTAPVPVKPVVADTLEPTYFADTFTLALSEDWKDSTIFILSGPVVEGMQHNVTVCVEEGVEVDSLIDYADWQVKGLEQELQGCRVLLKEPVSLDCGLPAYRAIFVWYPTEDLRIYQEQVYVLHESRGYKLTASFTKKTRKTLGPEVERIMFSFTPGRPAEV